MRGLMRFVYRTLHQKFEKEEGTRLTVTGKT
jgi:hypothetical protein